MSGYKAGIGKSILHFFGVVPYGIRENGFACSFITKIISFSNIVSNLF
jgi:hypothetical protein